MAGTWMGMDLTCAGAEVRVSARGSRDERTAPRTLGPDFGVESLTRFAASVRNAAARARPLPAGLLETARALRHALLGAEEGTLRGRLTEAARGPLLLRLGLPDPELQAVPWEALCEPGEAMGFWASSPDLLPVRGVTSSEPWEPLEVRGVLRVLAIAPTGSAGLPGLRLALAERIDAGEIEWLEPIKEAAARVSGLFDRLRREPTPHVLHFLGHGGHNESGVPVLRLGDDADRKEHWLPVELLAQQLKASFGGMLRLIVLEACEGARPSAFASAAEILARAGADAVVAHLWPVKADVARTCSQELYRALAGGDRGQGDIALAVNEARRAILGAFEGSAEAFSPVVYLRGPDGVLFDFKGRKLAPPTPGPVSTPVRNGIDPALAKLLGRPFSLVIGDRWKREQASLQGFRDKLHKELAKASAPAPPALPMSAVAQRFALHRGADKLGGEFQKAFPGSVAAPPIVRAFGRVIGPGVHTTLLRNAWLEEAVAEQQPGRTILVIQPSEKGALVLRRESGRKWKELSKPPAAIDPEKEIVLLRLYRGYTPEFVFTRPLLSEDDYLHDLRELESDLPRDLANAIRSTLSFRPALLVGLSMLTWHHRMLLHRLYRCGIPHGSLAVIEPEDAERAFWENGLGLPGKGGVKVVEAAVEALPEALEAMLAEGGS